MFNNNIISTIFLKSLDLNILILYLDCIHVKVRDNHTVINKAVYLAIRVNMEGKKELLGIWISKNEGAKFWMQVVTELKNRGVEKIYVACVDGLKGFTEAINSVFPDTTVQLCIVHMVRNPVKYVSHKDLKEVTTDLKEIYGSTSEEEGARELEEFTKNGIVNIRLFLISGSAIGLELALFLSFLRKLEKLFIQPIL